MAKPPRIVLPTDRRRRGLSREDREAWAEFVRRLGLAAGPAGTAPDAPGGSAARSAGPVARGRAPAPWLTGETPAGGGTSAPPAAGAFARAAPASPPGDPIPPRANLSGADALDADPPGATPSSATPPKRRREAPPSAPSPRPTPRAPRLVLPPAAPDPPALDRRVRRRLVSGRVAVEATLDLHGFTQVEAHRRLRAFVLDCHARGLRVVRVVTGKGQRDPDALDAARGALPERGVLRRMVPHWLGEAGLRERVAAAEPAARRHGGEGAIYVHLRRARGT